MLQCLLPCSSRPDFCIRRNVMPKFVEIQAELITNQSVLFNFPTSPLACNKEILWLIATESEEKPAAGVFATETMDSSSALKHTRECEPNFHKEEVSSTVEIHPRAKYRNCAHNKRNLWKIGGRYIQRPLLDPFLTNAWRRVGVDKEVTKYRVTKLPYATP